MKLPNLIRVNNLDRTNFQIIGWWELRRLLFNFSLLIITYLALKIIGLDHFNIGMGTGEYFILLAFIGIVIFLNILYTMGWVVELFKVKNRTFGPRIFKKLIWSSFIIITLFTSICYLILK